MSKRAVLLTLFILFGFLPTLGLLLLGVYRKTEYYVQNYTICAERTLELPVTMTSIAHHTPTSGRLHEVTFFQPGLTAEGKHTPLVVIPWADWLEYEILSEGKEVRRKKWTLPEMTLDSQSLEPLWTVHKRLLSKPELWENREILLCVEGPVRVGFDETPTLELHQAELRIHRVKGVLQTDVVFFVPESGREAQVVLSLRRIVQGNAQVMQATLTTDTGGLPASYLKSIFPMLHSLGPNCRFTGSIAIQQSFSRWSGFFRGRFDQVDAAFFLPQGGLSGLGTLDVEKARFDGSYLIQAEGKMRILQGSISRELLDRTARSTRLVFQNHPVTASQNPIPFREMAFRFQLTGQQMQIFGECQGPIAGVFITGTEGPILLEPNFRRNAFSRSLFTENQPTP